MNKNNELLDLAYAKLHALKMASISENDVATKFKLNRQIEELEESTGLKEKGLEKNISQLPKPSAKLVGRVEELDQLNQALLDKNKNIAYICAAGGIGKSALTFQWLKKYAT